MTRSFSRVHHSRAAMTHSRVREEQRRSGTGGELPAAHRRGRHTRLQEPRPCARRSDSAVFQRAIEQRSWDRVETQKGTNCRADHPLRFQVRNGWRAMQGKRQNGMVRTYREGGGESVCAGIVRIRGRGSNRFYSQYFGLKERRTGFESAVGKEQASCYGVNLAGGSAGNHRPHCCERPAGVR